VEVPGFSHWTVEAGLTQVEPPFCFLERMVTLRVHLDRVDAGNAPLAILPGSHRLGRLSETDIENLSRAAKPCLCLAEAGDVWAYGTPIIHASAASVRPKRRRVLQIDYSADALPRPLQWRGV
jgi:ectoine hydroxylase-related dioxygenase (phytanoyl-CoA dioxygenase family)